MSNLVHIRHRVLSFFFVSGLVASFMGDAGRGEQVDGARVDKGEVQTGARGEVLRQAVVL